MGPGLLSYIGRLELVAFFTGYPIVFLAVQIIGEITTRKWAVGLKSTARLLPFGYALVGTLYLGLVLRNLYPNYFPLHFTDQLEQNLLKLWGLSAILFWIPAVSRKKIISFFHSLFFIYLLVEDFLWQSHAGTTNDVLRNDMHMYTVSILLNTGAFAAIAILHFVVSRIRIH